MYWDQDLIECQFKCSNRHFSGQVRIYAGYDDLPRLAEALRGFPRSSTDSRTVELGTFRPDHGGGGVRLHLFCLDSVGHVAIDIKLRGDRCKAMGEVESVAARVRVEAAAIDSFVSELKDIDLARGKKTAFLLASD